MKKYIFIPVCFIYMCSVLGTDAELLWAQSLSEQWRKIGYHYLESQNPQKAISFFRQAVLSDKGVPAYRQELAYALQQSGRYDEALDEYAMALSLPSANVASIKYNMGLVYALKDDSDEAIRFFSEVLQVDSQYSNVYLNRANVAVNKEDYVLAEKDYKMFLELEPETSQKQEIEQILEILASLKTFESSNLDKEAYKKKQEIQQNLNTKKKRISDAYNKYLVE